MKTFHYIFLFLTLLFTGSCSFVDVVPDNIATIDYAFRSRQVAERYLFTCYDYRPRIGDLDSDPAMGGSDETWQRYSAQQHSWYPTLQGSYIARGEQSASTVLLNFWDDNLFVGIRDCNIFLEKIGEVPDLEDDEFTRWVAEVKFLKAYYHYFLFKCYGPIPVTDKNIPVDATPEQVRVYRDPVDSVVNYIANLMLEASADLPNAREIMEGTEAGRIDKLGALAMRAEVLLFAASPLFNGNSDYAGMVDNRGVALFNQTYDVSKWARAAAACKLAIDEAHAQQKALYDQIDVLVQSQPNPFQTEIKYRQAICDRWNKELLWGNTHYLNTGSASASMGKYASARLVDLGTYVAHICSEWAPTPKLVESSYCSNGVPIEEDKDWVDNGWYENRFEVRPEPSGDNPDEQYYVKNGEKTVYLHYNREPRFYASIGFDRGIFYGSGYYDFATDVKYCNFFSGGVSGMREGYSITGYAAKKMSHFKNTQQANQQPAFEFFPFPIMRLADLYLMYAEAVNEAENTASARTEALIYIDRIRDRVGLDGVVNAWNLHSYQPNKPSTQIGLRDIIHKERTIELALEGKRFWDIRRWKQIQELNNQPMGWNVRGETVDEFYIKTQVSSPSVKFSTKDYFWPISNSAMIVNNNLIQNYGW
ncbi:SusD family [Candidatus Symbiothrix dinenymphae]|nr:SusD family [Candidatus Symbiothrix dinenymphae]